MQILGVNVAASVKWWHMLILNFLIKTVMTVESSRKYKETDPQLVKMFYAFISCAQSKRIISKFKSVYCVEIAAVSWPIATDVQYDTGSVCR